MPVTRTTTAAVQFSLMANAAITLTSSQSSTLQLGLTGATNLITNLLARTDRVTLLTNLFGAAGTAPTSFSTNLTSLLSQMGSTGLGLRVQLRSASEMNGAMAAYAPNAPGGGVMVYLNADLLSNGTPTDVITYLLLEQYGQGLDVRLNGNLDSKGDEGKAFATALTGRTFTDAEMAVYGRDATGGVVNIAGTAVAVESEANVGPTATATALNSNFREADGLGSQAAPVAVFNGAKVSVGGANEAWQSITAFSLSVSGLRDGAGEVLWVDGTAIRLGAAGSGTTASGSTGSGSTASNGLAYTVVLSAGTATLSFSKNTGLSATATSALLNAIAYQNTNADDPTAGTRTITLISLSDSGGSAVSGGTAGGGTGTSNPNLSSTINVQAVNDGPQASATATNNTFSEAQGLATQAAAVAVFSNANINTIEAGQSLLAS